MTSKKFHIKHIEIYIILFFAATFIAIFFFIRGCQNVDEDWQAGYYIVAPVEKKDIPNYAYDYTLQVYIDGSSNREIKEKYYNYVNLYSNALAEYYACSNEESTYIDYVSIGYINKHLNEEISVTSTTYKLLEDAYNKTLDSVNYSIFATPMYEFYEYQYYCSSEEQTANDPANNIDTKNMMLELASYSQDRNHIDLKLLGNNKVKLVVSDDYINLIKGYELSNYIGLNVLKKSYVMHYVSLYLKANDINRGIMFSNSGITIQLDNSQLYSSGYYTLTENEEHLFVNKRVATVNMKATPNTQSSYRYYQLNIDDELYYVVSIDGKNYYRSGYIDISTGLHKDLYNSIAIYGLDYDILTRSWLGNELGHYDLVSEMKDYLINIGKTDTCIVVDYLDDDQSLYVSNNMKNYITIDEGSGYSLVEF